MLRAMAQSDASSSEMKRCPSCGGRFPLDYRVCPKDRTPLEMGDDDDDSMIGDVLAGSYCILGVIGEGGMGRVYEAEHTRLPRKYAVKIVALELANNAEAIGRLEREAQAASRIVHDNVLDVVDVVRARDGRPCLVTELLQGEELGVMLDRVGKLSAPDAVEVVRQVCRGLTAAHAQGVVHRDLKPENLFVSDKENGAIHVKVLDFGVAKMKDGANLTRLGTVVGTPAYMAPEQARGAPDVDGRADVYAAGAVLYRMLTGRPPFDDPDPARTLAKVVMEPPARPREVDPSIPEALELIVLRAMAKAPAQRYASAVELEKQLAAFAASVAAPPHGPASAPSPHSHGPASAPGPHSHGAPQQVAPAAQLPPAAQPAYVPRSLPQPPGGLTMTVALGAVGAAALTALVMRELFAALVRKPGALAPLLHLIALAAAVGAGAAVIFLVARRR